MDISFIFKKTAQLIIFQNKTIQNIEQNNILNRNKQNSFITIADLICTQINELYNIVQENRRACLNLSNLFINKKYISSNNHDEIDFCAQATAHKCLQLIKELKEKITYSSITQQNQEHNRMIISIIEEYLKRVCKMYSEQKLMRTKKTVKMKQTFKLQSWKIQDKLTVLKHFRHGKYGTENNFNSNGVDSFEIQEINGDMYQVINAEQDQWKPKDIQLFEAENELLYNELNTLTEEIKEIENKVVCISELQETFSEKILDQDKNLEYVLTTVVGSTENVKEANERIRNAIQRNAGFRVSILFFLLVLSFSLIFLDWYKP